jgi:hypothetical protein
MHRSVAAAWISALTCPVANLPSAILRRHKLGIQKPLFIYF